MSDTTLRLAEACERAAGEFEDLALMSEERAKYHGQKGYKERAEHFTANAKDASGDATQLRVLAAALRGAERDNIEQPNVYVLTIGDA